MDCNPYPESTISANIPIIQARGGTRSQSNSSMTRTSSGHNGAFNPNAYNPAISVAIPQNHRLRQSLTNPMIASANTPIPTYRHVSCEGALVAISMPDQSRGCMRKYLPHLVSVRHGKGAA